MILITGATGNNGSALVKQLSARGVPMRAFVRNLAHAQTVALPGVEMVEGDFAKPETFTRALEGVERLFLLMPSSSDVEVQQRHFVDAAKRSGVKHIVKLSQFAADEHAPGRFQRYHGAVEHYIRDSGIAFTFLRPNLFMQGLLNFRSVIASGGALCLSAGNARVSIVDVRDIASVVVMVLCEPGHEGKTYDITGPQALTHAEMAERLSEALGRRIAYVDIPADAMRQVLLDLNIPSWQAEGLVEDYEHYRRGEAAAITTTVRDITGAEPRTFQQFARDYAAEFGGGAVERRAY